MKTAVIAGGALAIVLVLLALIAGYRTLNSIEQGKGRAATTSPSTNLATGEAASEAHPSYLFGRVTMGGGATYEGRLRWGGDQEAFWDDYFNGFKDENSWAAHVPPERLPRAEGIEIFGIKIAGGSEGQFLGRPFMARFGDIARIERVDNDVRVTLKSGSVFNLDYSSANDFGDGVRVWDTRQGVLDLGQGDLDFGSRGIRAIDLLPTTQTGAVPNRLHGTVRTQKGDFTGFVQWNRNEGVGTDELDGRTADRVLSLRFDTIRSIRRHSGKSSAVKLLDGREVVLSGTPEAGDGNLGIYVDDLRYGRVLISWDAFERLDFSPGGRGAAYGDFPAGSPLTGSVTTRAGRRLAGRLIYDLDESETTETLDASSQGVNYNIPFGLVASIVLPASEERDAERAKVTLHSGEVLQLEVDGDLSRGNIGMLVFVDGRKQPEFAHWTEIKEIHFDRPSAMYPPLEGR